MPQRRSNGAIGALVFGSVCVGCSLESSPITAPAARAGAPASVPAQAGSAVEPGSAGADALGTNTLLPVSSAGATSSASGVAGAVGAPAADGGRGGARAPAAVGGSPARAGAGAAGAGGSLATADTSVARGFPEAGPWVSWYGSAGSVSTLDKVAATFRVINLDADPDAGNFTDAQIEALRANGKNRVISYLNLGSCEMARSYFSKAPAGFKSCKASGALTTAYEGYPDEMWADLSNADYQNLMVNYVAVRLAERGVDGFYLDNLEVVEHGANNKNGPCNSQCSQGGLDLVWQLRQRFPDKLIVMQNASSDVTRSGKTHGVAFPSLLDGVSHEEVYSNGGDDDALREMKAWRDMKLVVNGHPFWLAVEEYVGSCSSGSKSAADAIRSQAQKDGFSAYVTDASANQDAPCFF